MQTIYSMNLSVVIITYNEENNILKTLSSLPEGCEIIVLDSFSSDKTTTIAKNFGAIVQQREFDDFSSQRNYAITLASQRWIFCVDADEQLTPELIVSLKRIVQNEKTDFHCYRVKRKLIFMGKKLKFGKSSDHPIRFFRKGSATFQNTIHESIVPQSKTGTLKGELNHYSYKNITDYFNRFNNYTSQIAKTKYEAGIHPSKILHVFRPLFDFINRYLFRLGFLDGYQGFCYALFSSCYGFVKYAKLLELQNNQYQQNYELNQPFPKGKDLYKQ